MAWWPFSWGEMLVAIYTEVLNMRQEIADLHALVAEQKTVIDSATLLIAGLHEKLDAAVAANDMTEVAAIAADLRANTAALAAAVAANTEPAPVVEPVVVDPPSEINPTV